MISFNDVFQESYYLLNNIYSVLFPSFLKEKHIVGGKDLMQCACVCLLPKTFMLLIYQTNFMKRVTKLELNLNIEFRKVILQTNFIRWGKVWNHICNSLFKNPRPISFLISVYYFVPVEKQIRINTAQKIFQFFLAALFLLSHKQHLNLI